MTLRALCEAMITVSSNFAANLLIEKLDVQKIRATVTRLGADGMQVLRGVEDQKAFDKGMNNSTTARGLMVLLEKLGRGQAVSPSADAEMIEILKRQKFNDAIPAGVPAGTPVAHKTGTITRVHHDAAVVYGPRPYVLVVLVRGIQDQKQSAALIAEISKTVWQYVSSPPRVVQGFSPASEPVLVRGRWSPPPVHQVGLFADRTRHRAAQATSCSQNT